MNDLLELKSYSANIVPFCTVDEALRKFLSNSDIKRKKKEGSIKVGKNPFRDSEMWIVLGKARIIILPKSLNNDMKEFDFSSVAYHAGVYWCYHFEAMPRLIEWKKYE